MPKRSILALFSWAICSFPVTEEAKSQSTYPVRRQVACRGWTLHVKVPLWISAQYPKLRDTVRFLGKLSRVCIRKQGREVTSL